MNGKENIDQLLRRFMTGTDAAQAAREIRAGDEVFRTHPAPEISADLLHSIQLRAAAQLKREQVHRRAFWGSAAAVAAVALLTGIYWLTAAKPSPSARRTYVASTGVDLLSKLKLHDAMLSTMDAELTDLAKSMNEVQKDVPYHEDCLSIDLLELEELELLASNTDFWKG
ncbi:MAG: hypothetical protein LLF76_09585 [Planctomycetaceae bacterium]|nr:hypothetical protein [Planctomycetaceae bacterium]